MKLRLTLRRPEPSTVRPQETARHPDFGWPHRALGLGILTPRRPDEKRSQENPVKILKHLGILAASGLFLAACSSLPRPATGETTLTDGPQVYLVDGVSHTPTQMAELAARDTNLYYAVTPEAFARREVYVFTKGTEHRRFKEQYSARAEEGLSVQTSCLTDFDTRTSVYKGINYTGDVLKIHKGNDYDRGDLGSFDNTIRSVKGACNAWTDLYNNGNFTGIPWSTFGNNYSSLPSWIVVRASSVSVGW